MPERERTNQSSGSMLKYKKIKDIPEEQKGKDGNKRLRIGGNR
jgi:hypothetical protein